MPLNNEDDARQPVRSHVPDHLRELLSLAAARVAVRLKRTAVEAAKQSPISPNCEAHGNNKKRHRHC